MGSSTTKAKTRKWTKVVFAYLLDTVRVNASTVYALANGKDPKDVDAFCFGSELASSSHSFHKDLWMVYAEILDTKWNFIKV